MSDPLCVICCMLVGRRASAALTTVAGDAICGDHLKLRVELPTLQQAIAVARADLEPRIHSPALSLPVHMVRAQLDTDPLTDRERRVLRLLTSTMTAPEIARELWVSINTVKTHQRAIYRKLGVAGGRKPAVARARALGLLDPERRQHPGPEGEEGQPERDQADPGHGDVEAGHQEEDERDNHEDQAKAHALR